VKPEEDEVELKRFDNAFDAELALAFLREHDVRARLKGSGTSSMLDRFTIVVDIRLMVPRSEQEAGQRALEAMTLDEEAAESVAEKRADESLRDSAYRSRRESEEDDGPVVRDFRYRRGVIVGVLIAGAAHIHARQAVLGGIIFVSVVTLLVAGVSTGRLWTGPAAMMLIVYDIAHGVIAVDQHNAGRDPSARAQLIHGLLAVVVASLAGMALVAARPPRSQEDLPAAPASMAPAR